MNRHLLMIMVVIAFSLIVAYRACMIPITHDEAGTFLNFLHLSVWSCVSNLNCWGNANNHWLNTLLMQWSVRLFGEELWAIRLPNVLAGISYFFCAALLSARFIKNSFLQVAGFVVLCGHVYLLDFFSLARGYGLMSAGVLWAIYCMLRYIELWGRRWLLVSISALFFAILGNFTALLPWSAMAAAWLVWVLVSKKWDLLWRHGLYWFASAVLLFILLRVPITALGGSGEFEWGSSNPWLMGIDLLKNLLYGVHYFGEDTFRYALLLILFLVVMCLLGAVGSRYKEKKLPVLLMLLLLLMNILVIILQEQITGAQAPVGRKSVYLIPFVFGLFTVALSLLRNAGTISFVGIIVTLAFIGHLIFTLPMKSCREWYYDAYYPELFSEILPKGSDSDSVRLGNTWIFSPSLSFYQKTTPLPLGGLQYERPLVIDSTMDYYYVEQQDTAGMVNSGFEIEKRIGPFFLFKRE